MYKKLLVSLLIMGGVFIVIKLFQYYLIKDTEDFCLLVQSSDSIELVYAKANKFNYKVYKHDSNGTITLIVPTQDSPFFRFACVLIYKDTTLVSKEIKADD